MILQRNFFPLRLRHQTSATKLRYLRNSAFYRQPERVASVGTKTVAHAGRKRKLWQRKAFVCAFYKLQALFLLLAAALGWTHFDIIFCMLHACEVEQTLLWDSQHSHDINNMIHVTYIGDISKEEPLQVCFSFSLVWGSLLTATPGMWMENPRTVWQMFKNILLSQLPSDDVLAQPIAYLFELGFEEKNLKLYIFYFRMYGNMVEANIMSQ